MELVDTHRTSVNKWVALWGVPELADDTTIEWSGRMTSSLGRSHPRTRLVRIAAYLKRAEPALVEEVLCHEMAHVAAYAIHGENLRRPHGPEWKELMVAAGYPPKVRMEVPPGLAPKRTRRRSRFVYLHLCRWCKMSRLARRAMRRWRCARCRNNGFDGKLEIARVGP